MHRIARMAVGGVAAIVGLSAAIVATTPPAEALSTTQIKHAQTILNGLGCNAGPADGVVGMMSRAATVRFQSVMKISQNGTLDAPTYWRLNVSWRKRCDVRAVPPSGGGRRMVVSQSQNWLWLIDSAGHVVKQGGIIDNPSVYGPGTYYTGPKCGRPARVLNNSDGGSLILHNFVRYAPCGGGFHQIPTYRSTGTQIHPDYLLGTNYRESHGCIRVSRPMSDAIWNFAASSTKVVILR
jgi:peptidoglycan hydrolase-like protein with peptidoglycan-binding domain